MYQLLIRFYNPFYFKQYYIIHCLFNQLIIPLQILTIKLLNSIIKPTSTIIPPYLSSYFHHQTLWKISIIFWTKLLYFLLPNLILIFYCFHFDPAFVLLYNPDFFILINCKYCPECNPFGCYDQYCNLRLYLRILTLKLFYHY